MIASINAKCSDLCQTIIKDDSGKILFENDGYVPDFMPDEHYGDYVILDIDVKTGKIINWNTTELKIKKYIESEKK